MSSDPSAPERAYPYWFGWGHVIRDVLFFGLIGGIGVALFPTGYEKFQAKDLPTGIALMVIGVFAVPLLAKALWSFVAGVRDTFRPPVLRVTATALVLPADARGEPPQDEFGEPISNEPPQPAEVPFAAIRRVTRAGPRRNEIMEVTHDLSAQPVQIRQHMMHDADFEELEKFLRARAPSAFG